MPTSLSRPRNRILVSAATAAFLLAAAACGNTKDDDPAAAGTGGALSATQQACVDEANAYLEARGLLPESLPPELTPLAQPPTPGLTFTRLTPNSLPTGIALGEEIVRIAPEVGWTGRYVTYDGSVEDANRKAIDAIGTSDIVTVDGLPAAALQAPIRAAEEQGVLLMLNSITEPPRSVPGFGASAIGGDIDTRTGTLAANVFMRATDCQGRMAAFGLPIDATRNQASSMAAVLAEKCPDCATSYTDIPFADAGSPAATNTVVSKLQADPSINFAYFTIGDLAVGIEPALRQAGLQVQVGGAIPVPQNLAALKRGDNVFWVGFPQGMTAWLNIDTAVRALDSGEPTVGNLYPNPVFTPENIETTDPIPVYPADYQDEFRKLWLIG